MPETKEPETKDEVPFNVVYEPEEPHVVYANIVHVNTGPYDVRITFGRNNPEKRSEETITVSEATQVYMSPQHAKALLALLASQLGGYEKQYGPIPIDSNLRINYLGEEELDVDD